MRSLNIILKTEKFETEKTSEGQRGIIVGFDPGLTVGIAILDLNGKILSVTSFKEISLAEIIKHIMSQGKAVLIATDVYPPPKTVKKLASSLNSKIHSPYRSMSIESKIGLVGEYIGETSAADVSKVIRSDEVPQNDHERDALAAAIKTYKDYRNKLEQIEKRAENFELPDHVVDDIKIMVINDVSISNAIESVLKVQRELENVADVENEDEEFDLGTSFIEEEGLETPTSRLEISKFKKRLKAQDKQINNLKQKNSQLQQDIEKYRSEISKLESKLDKLYYEYSRDILYKKEMASKVETIKRLQGKYNEEKARRCELEENLRLIKSTKDLELSKNVVPVKIIESFTKEGIKRACDYWKIKKGDVVFLRSSEGGGTQTASLLIHMGIKAVIIADKMAHQAEEEFEKHKVPILDAKMMELEMIDEFAIIKSETLKKQIGQWNKDMEARLLKEERKKLLKVIDEYRAKRKRLDKND
ncbi:MAG: DUF460 domain-containing protein [Methanobacterium paludis]|nr:DUF460 domain-containing protein [Methanobacterium paludis]